MKGGWCCATDAEANIIYERRVVLCNRAEATLIYERKVVLCNRCRGNYNLWKEGGVVQQMQRQI